MAADTPKTREIPIVTFDTAGRGPKVKPVRDLLPGEIPGVTSRLLSLGSKGKHKEAGTNDKDRVFLFLRGSGTFRADGKSHAVEGETIARLPVGTAWEIGASAGASLDVLILDKTLSEEDRGELKKYPQHNAGPYIKKFSECETYGESIKSAKTTSRTLLPENIVPRMAIGTVQTIGPDKVGAHAHPMLEQLFLGLPGNEIIVHADAAQVKLPENAMLHIPVGASHWAEVAEGKKMHYIWMDFFSTREGQLWLKTHKPNAPASKPTP
jgi:mannose-6-phosphate isomerase-like protein (cupin superfamily)